MDGERFERWQGVEGRGEWGGGGDGAESVGKGYITLQVTRDGKWQ